MRTRYAHENAGRITRNQFRLTDTNIVPSQFNVLAEGDLPKPYLRFSRGYTLAAMTDDYGVLSKSLGQIELLNG